MRVLFDHNVPYGLRRTLEGHDVSLADELGWAAISNGDLLRAAEESSFQVMVTCDKNLSYQQNLRGRKIALVVLDTNNWKIVRRNMRPIIQAVEVATPGSYQFVEVQA